MLIASDMLSLAEYYKKDVGMIHKIFYEVSCDRDALIDVLKDEGNIQRWSVLEDLALKQDKASESYLHVVQTKGEESCEMR